ncbi:hypothetical protein DPMN_124288 [Dreissena polymorpha]|uniref:Uncharacterized protein n=1 Tax=Dreissena polymorpha TaxID=45954 RepID=A0A9D4GVC2_DREPO|nr:hypothetical protein DPMN_124288 [Dreissena polymorpha]
MKYFVARLYKSTPEANLELIIHPIQQALGDVWQLNFGNISIKLAPSFNDFITVSGSYNNNIYLSMLFQEDVESNPFVETMIRLSKMQEIQSPHLIITKSYFCQQVDVFHGEYVDNQYQVYLRSINKTLVNGKFRRLQTSDGNDVIRVCYDDIGLEWLYTSNYPRVCTNVSNDLVLCVIVGIGASVFVLN